jgi:hypothetical protein
MHSYRAKWIIATVARAKSEDIQPLARGGATLALHTEEDLKNNIFPPELVARFFGTNAGWRVHGAYQIQ